MYHPVPVVSMPSSLTSSRLRSAHRCARSILLAVGLGAACGRNDPTSAPTPQEGTAETVATVRAAAHPITGSAADYDSLLAVVGDARIVLLGEATHGTHEFYRERARITQRLIRERGFTAVAVEGGWGETYRVNEYVRGMRADASAEQALSDFTTFPRWMWANTDVRDLVRWIRTHNDAQPAAQDVGFYGLDIQALAAPMQTLLRTLGSVDAGAADRVRARLSCLAPYAADPQRYGAAVARASEASCQPAVAAAVAEVRARSATRPSDPVQAEALFAAARSAEVLAHGEEYFRAMHTGTQSTWNLRDRRMDEGLQALEAHLGAVPGRAPKVVVWAHNTHTGDARETESGEQGELNIGQLARERLGAAAVTVGFLTYAGTVFAAPAWGSEGRRYDLRPGLPGSYDALLHDVRAAGGPREFLLVLRGQSAAAAALAEPRLERAVGVVYAPQTERQSHYFTARLSRQFDVVVYVDSSTAVQPLTR
jgi:erythromycin esterase-like protein